MKTRFILTTMLLFLCLTVSAKPATFEAPFSQIIQGSCIGESVALTGILKTQVISNTTDDGYTKIQVTDWIKGTGVGLESGAKYNLKGKTTTRIILTTEALESYTFKNTLQCVGAGPADNLTINYTFRQDAAGVVIESFEASCK